MPNFRNLRENYERCKIYGSFVEFTNNLNTRCAEGLTGENNGFYGEVAWQT